jgi:hypothetical protein
VHPETRRRVIILTDQTDNSRSNKALYRLRQLKFCCQSSWPQRFFFSSTGPVSLVVLYLHCRYSASPVPHLGIQIPPNYTRQRVLDPRTLLQSCKKQQQILLITWFHLCTNQSQHGQRVSDFCNFYRLALLISK